MEADQAAAYREGSSSGHHDEGLVGPPAEEVAGQVTNHQGDLLGTAMANLDFDNPNLAASDSSPPASADT
uniref:Uncharacterized protein n=1 Tax=Cannabis sativa TaxID=3483 RepID=A0A803PYC7_CANSA